MTVVEIDETVELEQAIRTQFYDGFNKRNIDGMFKMYAEDALIHAWEGPVRGHAALKKILNTWLEAMPNAQMEVLDIKKEKGILVAHWRAKGTLEKPLRDFQPNGKSTVWHGITCFRHEKGQVVEHWATVDYRAFSGDYGQ